MTAPVRALVLYACTTDNSTFSYQRAWPRHLTAHPAFTCTGINVADRSIASRLHLEWVSRSYSGDAIILLHSVFSNALMLSERVIDQLAARPQPKVYFIGNEYKLMPEKMTFCDRLRLALLVSQSLSEDVHQLYRRRLGCAVTGIPNTGLDTQLFRPTTDPERRAIDLGYRAADSPIYLGHQERRELAEYFVANADRYGITVDISLDAGDRLDEAQWAAFLNRCKGQLGSEAGGDYFDLEDRTRQTVHEFVSSHPGAAFADIAAACFPPPHPHVPLRILSGRHVEAAGTQTTQVLFTGTYDGMFVANEHYIPLEKDFSDADEALRKFKDPAIRRSVADRAYAYAHEELTYHRLIERVQRHVQPLV